LRISAMIPIYAVRCCINMDTILGRLLRLSTIYASQTYLGLYSFCFEGSEPEEIPFAFVSP